MPFIDRFYCGFSGVNDKFIALFRHDDNLASEHAQQLMMGYLCEGIFPSDCAMIL